MEKVYIVYKLESYGQYDYSQERPKFLMATKFKGRADMWQTMGKKLGVEILVQEMIPDEDVEEE